MRQLQQVEQVSPQSDDPIRLLTELKLSDYNTLCGENRSLQNISEKSVIYAPFNTTLRSSEQDSHHIQSSVDFGDITYSAKVREANRQYEFNYNGEVDNGMLIGAAKDTPAHADASGDKDELQ